MRAITTLAAAFGALVSAAGCATGLAGPAGAGAAAAGAAATSSGSAAAAGAVVPTLDPSSYAVFAGGGEPSSLDALVEAMAGADVVLIGEVHDDSLGHVVEAALLEAAWRRWGETRPFALSLEMFERDVQLVLDEYLGGIITEEQFRAAARPWGNYRSAYRPLVELARAEGFPVVAANVPRRYVNLVSRKGPAALDSLDAAALAWLPPLPYPPPSERYRARWDSVMAGGGHDAGVPPTMLDAQALWDAGMAHAIVRAGERAAEARGAGASAGGAGGSSSGRAPGAATGAASGSPLVVHLSGSFHVERGMGITEALAHYRPGLRVLALTIRPAEDNALGFVPAQHAELADYVVITAAPRREGR